ncbi:MAG: LLM class flavin-dependent oxidoreductase [Egibacteraceae bacterium]
MLTRSARVQGVGLSLREALPPPRLREVAQALDAHEGTSLWLPEFALRESFGQLGYVAASTARVRLANGVAPMAARTPVASALAAATIEDLSGGRAVLGLGVSHSSMTGGWHGQEPGSQLQWAADYLRVVRQVLDGHATDLDGEELRSRGFELLGGARPDVPVVLAALGPRMLELGGRLADGVLLNWTTPSYASDSRDRVTQAATDAGRPPPVVGAYVRVAAGPDAARQARMHTDFYTQLPAYHRSLVRMGFSESDDMTAKASDALILRGSAEDVAGRMGEWADSGVDPVVVYPVGDGTAIGQTIDLALDVVALLAAERRRASLP